ncbi:hypothetical protein RIR_jg26149.t1 [Rhizophagus irregularis DAOM 181602=DAOM 197198]|nr:hypothetical protein RIR_jg26149.t1 [Rhizophagus irregularis DAOM 181602=DAOM 197198]
MSKSFNILIFHVLRFFIFDKDQILNFYILNFFYSVFSYVSYHLVAFLIKLHHISCSYISYHLLLFVNVVISQNFHLQPYYVQIIPLLFLLIPILTS